jgi:hypothetical protein
MDKRPEITAREAQELIKGKGRVATLVVHENGVVTANAVGPPQSILRLQKEVDELLRDIQLEYRIVKSR